MARSITHAARTAPVIGRARLVAAIVGFEIWLVVLLILPAPVIERIFLAAPLVIVPALLSGLPRRPLPAGIELSSLAPWPALLAAVPLMAALSLPPGMPAAVLAGPWLLACALAGVAALAHGLSSLPGLLRPAKASELATDGALGLLAVGGLFLLAHRLGLNVLGFGPTSVLLGAVHYHFLGFGLLSLAALAAHGWKWPTYGAAVAIVAGVPLSAAGMILRLELLNLLGVLLVAAGVAAVIVLLLGQATSRQPGFVRLFSGLAALSLAAGISLGVGWAASPILGFALLDHELMVRTHGVLNASGVLLGALAAVVATGRRQ